MLIVKKSRIPNAGRGLFTTSRIRKGDEIIEYLGDRLTWKQCLHRYRKDLTQLLYVFAISDNNCIDAKPCPDELAQYANDANGGNMNGKFKNNCEYNIIKGRSYIVATKNITPNSEILVDYGDEYWDAIKENAEEKEKKEGKKKKSVKVANKKSKSSKAKTQKGKTKGKKTKRSKKK